MKTRKHRLDTPRNPEKPCRGCISHDHPSSGLGCILVVGALALFLSGNIVCSGQRRWWRCNHDGSGSILGFSDRGQRIWILGPTPVVCPRASNRVGSAVTVNLEGQWRAGRQYFSTGRLGGSSSNLQRLGTSVHRSVLFASGHSIDSDCDYFRLQTRIAQTEMNESVSTPTWKFAIFAKLEVSHPRPFSLPFVSLPVSMSAAGAKICVP